MSRVVFKYRYNTRWSDATLPEGKVVLFGRDMDNNVCVWIEHEVNEPEAQHLEIFGTGAPIPPNARHVASFADLPYIWHLYRIDGA